MKNKSEADHELSPAEVKLIKQLREHPEMLERLRSILDLTCHAEGPLKTADEVEELLIQELRQLGHTSMGQWAKQAEARVSDELTRQDPTLRSRKKKVLKWSCVFGAVAVRDRVWRSLTQRYVRPLPQRLGVAPRGRSRRLQRVLTDFGCEHSFARAADSVLEHYGLTLGSTAVRTATLTHAHRARVKLEEQYAQPFRVLPAVGAEHVIAETDGTMICTVAPGPRKSKRPRQWQEMRLAAAQAKDSATTFYGAPSGAWPKPGGGGGIVRARPGGASIVRFTRSAMGPSGSRFSAGRCSGSKPPFSAISFTSASIWARRPSAVGPPSRNSGAAPNSNDCAAARSQRCWPP